MDSEQKLTGCLDLSESDFNLLLYWSQETDKSFLIFKNIRKLAVKIGLFISHLVSKSQFTSKNWRDPTGLKTYVSTFALNVP